MRHDAGATSVMRFVLSVSAALLTACASSGGGSRTAPTTESSPDVLEGTYQFTAGTPNQIIRGSLRVTDDQMGVQFETACQSEVGPQPFPRGMPSSTSFRRYYCSGAWLMFDNRNPRSAKWYATVQLPRQRQVCVRYETRNGRQVCGEQGSETYFVYETRSGGIQVQKVP